MNVSNDFNTTVAKEHYYFLDSHYQANRFHNALLDSFTRVHQSNATNQLNIAIVGQSIQVQHRWLPDGQPDQEQHVCRGEDRQTRIYLALSHAPKIDTRNLEDYRIMICREGYARGEAKNEAALTMGGNQESKKLTGSSLSLVSLLTLISPEFD